uniref:pentapeptide repeat-containing protein n=2 Tax=unclassified Endozoicomonas TaxID=2644528 RepID=UPI0021483363
VQLAEFSHGFAKLTGQSVNYMIPQQLKAAGLTVQPVRALELESIVCEGGSILFFPPNLPEGLSFENQLTLTFGGHSKMVVEALFRELAGLGIGGERPATDDLEEQWLDALADCHGCLGDMNIAVAANSNTPVNTRKKAFLKPLLNLSDKELNWKFNSRIRAGRLVHYRPGFPHGISANPARHFCPGHDINLCRGAQRNSKQGIVNSLENEATLSSFERRTQIGMEPSRYFSARRMKCDTEYTFSRVMEEELTTDSRHKYGGVMCMRLTSAALGRLDAQIYKDQSQFLGGFPGLDAFARNEKIIAQSTDDYRSVIQYEGRQETRFSNPLSLLDELNLLEMSSPESQRQLLQTLKQRFSHWPDGRPLEQLFPQSWSVFYHELTFKGSMVDEGIKNLIKVCGEERIQLLFEQNPQLLEGKLDSLDGFKLNGGSHFLKGIDFSGCSMKGTVLQSFIFQNCKFDTERLNSATVEDGFFCACSFEGKRFSSSILDNARFYPENDQDDLVYESTHQLSRILYNSCVNQRNEFSLKQWLEVMGKSDYLLHDSARLDDLSRDILSRHIGKITKTYPQQLCRIIRGFFSIDFENTANAISFVWNNPEFYDRKIKDLKDVYFEFRTIFLNEGDYKGMSGDPFERLFTLYKVANGDCSREAVLALMLNVINLILFPESNDKYIDFGMNANRADEHDDCWKDIPEVSSESTQNHSTPRPETEGLPLVKMRRYKASLCRMFLKDYRDCIDQFWKECSEKSQLKIAKHCLLHQNVAVSPSTTTEFINLLSKDRDEGNWRDIYNANMKKHTEIQNEWDRLFPEYFRT